MGSLNLNEFVKNPFSDEPFFEYEEFAKAISVSVEALDTILDENADNHPLKEQKENSLNYRNIGLGIMGYANALIKLKIQYGSDKAKEFTKDIFKFLFKESVYASNKLSEKKGSFPKYKEIVFSSTIVKNHFSKEEIDKLKQSGLRNCSLISVAPTGSIATMMGVSGGVEPEFALSYQRKTESLNYGKEKTYTIYCKSVSEFLKKYPTTNPLKLPPYFVTSSNIKWKDRIDIQSIMQESTDTAISSTINLIKETSVQEIESLYLYAWEKGLKGITIYRTGCKKDGILTASAPVETEEENTTQSQELPWGTTIQISDDLIGKKRKIITGCGSVHVQTWFDPESGRLMETFFSKGSSGGCLGNLTALSRMTSLALRTGADFHYVIDQLKSVPACPAYAVRCAIHKDCSKGNNCASAIANAFEDMYNEVRGEIFAESEEEFEDIAQIVKTEKKQEEMTPKCPECGSDIRFQEGCQNCPNCSYSKCG